MILLKYKIEREGITTNPIDKIKKRILITNEEQRIKIKLADYIYKELCSKTNKKDIDELMNLVTDDCFYKNKPLNCPNGLETGIVKRFYDYLLSNGVKESTAYDYVQRVKRILAEFNTSIEEVIRKKIDVQTYIDTFSKGGERYEENKKKHNALSSALKWFKRFIISLGDFASDESINQNSIPYLELNDDLMCGLDDEFDEVYGNYHRNNNNYPNKIYVRWEDCFHSFNIVDKHPIFIEIDNGICLIKYERNRVMCAVERKIINDEYYAELVSVFKKYKNILSVDGAPSRERFPFGGVGDYYFIFEDKENLNSTPFLFESDNDALLDQANEEFNNVLDKIIKQ